MHYPQKVSSTREKVKRDDFDLKTNSESIPYNLPLEQMHNWISQHAFYQQHSSIKLPTYKNRENNFHRNFIYFFI